jgi:hypothetical protein
MMIIPRNSLFLLRLVGHLLFPVLGFGVSDATLVMIL